MYCVNMKEFSILIFQKCFTLYFELLIVYCCILRLQEMSVNLTSFSERKITVHFQFSYGLFLLRCNYVLISFAFSFPISERLLELHLHVLHMTHVIYDVYKATFQLSRLHSAFIPTCNAFISQSNQQLSDKIKSCSSCLIAILIGNMIPYDSKDGHSFCFMSTFMLQLLFSSFVSL